MKTLLLSDIFGKTEALVALANELDAQIIDPYEGKMLHFDCEQAAYDYFMLHVGLDGYLNTAKAQIPAMASALRMIGFSVGGAILWRLAASEAAEKWQHCICYYPSQVRHFSDLQPRCPIQLVFPCMETHFDVSALHAQLSRHPLVTSTQLPYRHGFMNRHSVNFDLDGYQQQRDKLVLPLDAGVT